MGRKQKLLGFIIIVLLLVSLMPAAAFASNNLQTQYAFRHITTDDGLSNNEILGLQFQPDGTLLIETQAGWNQWNGKQVSAVKWEAWPRSISPTKKEVQRLSGNIALPKSSALNTILDVKDDRRGNLWLATDHQGVYIYNKVSRTFTNLVHSPSQSTSLAENHVNCIAISKDGTVALGHLKKGISLYKPFPFRLTHFQSTTWRNVSAVMEDRLGNLWIGTDGYGLFNITQRKHIEIPGNIVVSLLEDKQGRLWVGTYKEGLLCIEGDKIVKQYTKQNSRLSDNNVYSLVQDRYGKIWIGTLFGHLQCLDPVKQQWQDFKSKGSKSEAMVMDFSYDGKDQLYAGTLWGLARINVKTGEREQLFTNKAGQPFLHEDIQSVVRDSHGNLWIAHGKGMSVWNTRTDAISYLTKENGLCDDIIRSICEDGKGRIWIGTSNGLSVASPPAPLPLGPQGRLPEQEGEGSEMLQGARANEQETQASIGSLGGEASRFAHKQETQPAGMLAKARTQASSDNHSPLLGEELGVRLFVADGLLDNNFSRHSIIRLHDGNIIMGSYEGYSLVNLTGKPCDMEQTVPYEIGEEWTVWTSWQAIVIYLVLVASILTTYLLMRRAKKRAIARAIKKAEEIWAANQGGDTSLRHAEQETQASGVITPLPMGEGPGMRLSSLDQQFLSKATKTVEDNIANDLTTEQLAEAMALTRGHLYKRLMALTGMAPSDFIRSIRLKRACLLLESSGMQVAEVAYAVGYSSPKIFSRNFKAEYGMTPTEYKKRPQ